MARNPESVVTGWLRRRMSDAGLYSFKLSDSFTRGVPDAVCVGDRVVMVEFKVDRGLLDFESYSALGLSGAQDQRIREICRRAPTAACVVTARPSTDDKTVRLWSPVEPERSGPDYESYKTSAIGLTEVLQWLTTSRT